MRRRARKFLALSGAERRLLIESILIVGAVCAALLLLSVRRVQHLLALGVPHPSADGVSDEPLDPSTRDRVVRAVDVAAYFIPGASCLPRSLAAQRLLWRRGFATRIRIGVAKRGPARLAAHAWLEDADGGLVYDPENRSEYTPLPPLESMDADKPDNARAS